MFCYQCEQAADGKGCALMGVCGKDPDVAALQDLLTYCLQGLSQVAVAGREAGIVDEEVDTFVCHGLFTTLTNVNFDEQRFVEYVSQCVALRDALKEKVAAAGGPASYPEGPATVQPTGSLADLVAQGGALNLSMQPPGADPDLFSLKSLLLFGLRGVASYADHARILGQTDDAVSAFVDKGLAATARDDLSLDDLLGLCLKCGEVNLRTMELLDAGHTSTYGHPVPTSVPLGAKKGKAILISGHDLLDLACLLEQTEGKGITVYTHGEMLPAHGYPGLKKHPHLCGNYGGAWQDQAIEFAKFPGAILMTTNCIQKPRSKYKDNIFTCGATGWPGVRHITDRDFTPVIEKALEMDGFPEDTDKGSVMVGFAHNAVLGVADKVIQAVKDGNIKHFFLVGGCDGAKPGRNYYTELVEQIPSDCIVLTLACGKFRFYDQDLGDIDGIPRLLDVGQCNDAYSAVAIASALADAFECGVNDLPLSLVLSWFEQKAVAILLSLLYLGIKDIRLGPTLPAFVTPNVLNVLVEKFDIKSISTPEKDLAAILG